MPRRTQTYQVMPWVGGINTSVDPGVLNSQELVQADNVQFSSSGARIKREAFEYLDQPVPQPDFRSSTGTSRTLKFTSSPLINIASPNERLVVGEKINVTGNSNYNATNAAVTTVNEIEQVLDVTPVSDVSGSLAGKYWLVSAGDGGTDYYVWYKVSGVGTDPAIAGRTGIEVAISTNDTASAVATATDTAMAGNADFTVSALGGVITVVNAVGGYTATPGAGDSGFSLNIVTVAGHSITYNANSSFSESLTASGAVEVARASAVIAYQDYWRYSTGESNTQLGVYATDDFQLFSLDDAGRRVQIHGQEQISAVVCLAASTITTGDYFLLNSANNATNYYVWYNKDGGDGDPVISGRTGIEVEISTGDTAADIAQATHDAIGLMPGGNFSVDLSATALSITSDMSLQVQAASAIESGDYFLLNSVGDEQNYYVWYNKQFKYYAWFDKSNAGPDPAVPGRNEIEIDIGGADTSTTVAAAIETAVEAASTNMAVTLDSDLVTITADGQQQIYQAKSSANITSGEYFLITFTGDSADPQISGRIGIEVIIDEEDTASQVATKVKNAINAVSEYHTADSSSATVTITPYGAGFIKVCPDGDEIPTGDYFLLNALDNSANYYVWYDVSDGGGDPGLIGRTGIRVDISSASSGADVATATESALASLAAEFDIEVSAAAVEIANSRAGLTDPITDGNTGFSFSTIKYGATAPTTTVNQICTGVVNERLLLAFSGLGNYPIRYNPDENDKYQLWFDNIVEEPIGPDCSFFFFHQGRVWANEKTNKHRMHYSETFDETKWFGLGDSGALDVVPGDGDPEGITGGYPYKGQAIIGKKLKRYRILGDSPENYQVVVSSEGFGMEGPMAIPVDENDVIFISRRGFHSQAVTDTYGALDSSYLSSDIKPTFNEFEAEDLKYVQGAYIPELNSVAFSITEDGQTQPNSIWLYNVEVQVPGKQRPGVWYRWPDLSCTALSRRLTNGKYKLVIGTNDGRVAQAQRANNFSDFSGAGIPYAIKTGTIYPNNDPHSIKAFKKISMIYRPKGNFAFNVKVNIDNLKAQAFSFNQISGLDLLGESFVLGNSILGSSNTLAPFTFTMDGHGRGITIEVTQPSAEEQIEIWGFILEYEYADLRQSADE